MEIWHKIEGGKIVGGKIVKTKRVTKPPRGIATDGDGNPVWRQEIRETVDTSTGADKHTETAAPVIEADRVLVVTTIRDMTTQEITDRDNGRIDIEIGAVLDRMLGKALLAMVNDLRELKSQPPLTRAQFRTWLRNQAKA